MHGDVNKYYTDEWDKDSGRFKLKEGYSHVAHQDAPDALASITDRKNQRGGTFETSDPQYIYKKVDTPAPVAAAVAEPDPAPDPESEPEPTIAPPIEYSPEIQEAKERVSAYKNKSMLGENSAQIYNSPEQATSFLDSKKYQFRVNNYKNHAKLR